MKYFRRPSWLKLVEEVFEQNPRPRASRIFDAFR
jgi:hypothetical protein